MTDPERETSAGEKYCIRTDIATVKKE